MKMTKNDKNLPHTIFLILALFAADGFVIFGSLYAPEGISHFSCALLPLAKISSLFVFNLPLNFVDYQCPGLVLEPNISAIFLLVKTTLTIFVAAYFVAQTVLFGMQDVRGSCSKYVQENNSLIEVFKNEFLAAPAALTVVYLFIAFQLNAAPHKFRTDFFNKFFEDIGCLVLFAALAAICRSIIVCITYALDSNSNNHTR